MRTKLIGILILTSLLTTFANGQDAAHPPTARDYYDQLVKSNGLEGFSNMYVCFKDDATDTTFWTFSRSQDIKRLMESDPHTFSPSITSKIKGDYLFLATYNEGVIQGELLYPERDPKVITIDSYVEKIVIDNAPFTLRFSVNMKTLRFRRSIERSNGVEVFRLFGTCTDRTVR